MFKFGLFFYKSYGLSNVVQCNLAKPKTSHLCSIAIYFYYNNYNGC